MIEEDVIDPGRLVVAILACNSLLAIVRIIRCVAVIATRLQRDFVYRLQMTGLTFDCLVSAYQCMRGIPVVVKEDVCPERVAVAIATLGAKMTVVLVVVQVAGNAGRLQLISERLFGMTIIANQLGMAATESKARVPAMVETGIGPGHGVMAAIALLATSSVVDIVVSMAVVARGRRVLKRLVLMAVSASGFAVSADQ